MALSSFRLSGALALFVLAGHSLLVYAQPSGSGNTPSAAQPTSPPPPPEAPSPNHPPLSKAYPPPDIFCPGALLQTVDLAQLYSDSKTFVDKPTVFSPNTTLADFARIGGANATIGNLEAYVEQDFSGEGLELVPVQLENFTSTPGFLQGVRTRLSTNTSALCDGLHCASSLIPLNNTFVIPGGRFREQYYWDSFWILEGLLQSELYYVARSTLENFMDELERFGFIPNGGRIYYLNRSQPPLFVHMVYTYLQTTNDSSILTRALPLAEVELAWWQTNRSTTVLSPNTNTTHTVYQYRVTNSAPRPESYLEDYQTANANAAGLQAPLSPEEAEELYAELASGAETGWDYSSRWCKQPFLGNLSENDPALRTLDVRGVVPVDLNSMLPNAHWMLARMYDAARQENDGNVDVDGSGSGRKKWEHERKGDDLREAVLDLMWDEERVAFYDWNLTAGERGTVFSSAHYYPFWNNIIPPSLLGNATRLRQAFGSLNLMLDMYNGSVPVTFLNTGLQWDFPNATSMYLLWVDIILRALQNLPGNLTFLPLLTDSTPELENAFALLPANQTGLSSPSLLPLQPGTNISLSTKVNVNAGQGWLALGLGTNGTSGWKDALMLEVAQRYIDAAFCSWYSTGGSIPGSLAQLSPQDLSVTGSTPQSTGVMFEKFNATDLDAAGGGGEYTVQAGLG
ncbi:glycoside hydrolase [Dacryopinax primogenitus]|uniref:Trehalase n=1 Tax=Dacryopinax primogenitus (strain DJM 731) TaxID=1858805 RepID=M5FYA3_DACPD|nr:glycoside hydrolase [Dacryopinax primogenitus]EJU03036.1 glycoside hydrolase [Dacryopinax primogenitus]